MWTTIFTRVSWPTALLAGALVTFSSYASGTTIVSVTDAAMPVNRSSLFLGGEFSNVVATSWTQALSFSDVTIEASLVSIESTFRSGTAYLLDAIGPGTTPASEVVPPENFTAPIANTNAGQVPLTVLFSGLTLGPGTYYLVLSAPSETVTGVTGSPLTWQVPTDPVTTTAPSASIGSAFEANTVNSTVSPFPPASSFLTTEAPIFEVIAIPEPKTSALVLMSIAAMILYRNWSNRATRFRRAPKES
jgi:hypothetical protein